MHFFRKILKQKKLAALLLVGIALRSLVATGFMLDTGPADGKLFSIKLCDGPAGINAIVDLSEQSAHAQHHHHHDETHDDNHEHASPDHVFSACSFWSTSSQLLLAEIDFFNAAPNYFTDEHSVYQAHFRKSLTGHSRLARAPPHLV